MKMYGVVMSSLFLFGILVSSYNCWVITDINYEKLDLDNDINDILDDDLEDIVLLKFSLIYPGTKWCGAGNVAEDYDDLGTARETDMCCREHDNCPDIIPAGETKYNITNKAFYTRLHCDCDESFRKCLNSANSTVAKRIGKIYFNALGTKCFKEDYPITGCSAYGGWFNTKCLQYTFDKTAKPLYQWFDVNNY